MALPVLRGAGPAAAQGDEDAHGDGEEQEGDGGGGLGFVLEQEVDLEREGLGGPGQVPGEGDRGAELAERPRPGERRAREDPGRDHRQRDGEEDADRRGPEGGRRLLVPGAESAERALQADDEERHGDERRRDHRAGGVERQGDAEGVLQPRPEQPAPAEGQEQRDAADGRRQHHRQQDERADDRLAGEGDPCEQPGQGTPRSSERPSAQKETRSDSFSAWTVPGAVRWPGSPPHSVRTRMPIRGSARKATAASAGSTRARAAGNSRDAARGRVCLLVSFDGPGEVGAWSGGAARLPRCGQPLPIVDDPVRYGFWKPASRRIFWPSGEDSQATNAAAASAFSESFSVAAGYLAIAFWSSGISTASTLSCALSASVL